jgi:cytosine/adenosine deaminase-related metal-dependent hydrolase
MSKLLIHSAEVLVTMNPDRQEIKHGALYIEDHIIQAVGTNDEIFRAYPRSGAIDVIDASGMVVVPGLINCHHHLFQTLTRSIGTAEGLGIFDWLKMFYPIWAQLDREAIYTSAMIGISELLLSGATTVSDHLIIYPNDVRIDEEIQAARELGVRFHPARGSMSLGESHGGLPPDEVCESEQDILQDCVRVIETFHDPEPFSMCRVALAPCSFFYSVTEDLMRESVHIARRYKNVGLHTHLSEVVDEVHHSLENQKLLPLDYAEQLGWVGEDVWFAHAVHMSGDEINTLAKTQSGVCHCPTSNMILASGMAPIRDMLDAGVRVALGVDGSASNDSGHLLAEARQAMLLQRVGWPGFTARADRLSAREALEMATLGGAKVLNRQDELGSLEPGKAADIVGYRVDDLAHAGALYDPVAALVTCQPTNVWFSIINGKKVVDQGSLTSVNLEPIIAQHNRISKKLYEKAGV